MPIDLFPATGHIAASRDIPRIANLTNCCSLSQCGQSNSILRQCRRHQWVCRLLISTPRQCQSRTNWPTCRCAIGRHCQLDQLQQQKKGHSWQQQNSQQSHQQPNQNPFAAHRPTSIITAMSQVMSKTFPFSASWSFCLRHTLHWTALVIWLADTGTRAATASQLIAAASNRQQVAPPISDQSSLIIDANHHYPNYNYPNSFHRPIQRQHSHSNEPQLFTTNYDWSSGQMNNLTASVGRNATFECVFPELKQDFRLAWFHKDKHTLLALHDSVIVKNGRVSVRSHANTTFYLTIHDIRYEDRGFYECQINSVPMRKKLGHLEVNVPPSFNEQITSSDLDIDEESSASLHCSADGRPTPEISWRREDGNLIDFGQLNKSTSDKAVSVWKGEFLNITKATRAHSGAYLCIASNGIPSPISKRIFLGVSFAPLIWSNKEELGIYLDSSVVLQCNLESYPRPSFYWQKDDNMPPIIHSDKKYEISLLDGNTSYRFILRLKILNVLKSDFGKYTCFCKNGIAEAKTSMRLYEIKKLASQTLKPNKRPKNIFLDIFTTRIPAKNETKNEKKSVSKVPDTFSFNQESAKAEVFDYETNFISPEMGTEAAKENKATSHLAPSWPILLSSSLLLLQRVFVFAC